MNAVAEAGSPLTDRVLGILSQVPDPEIPCVSVVDLGIVREVRADAVVITPTYTGCPATHAIAQAIRAALDREGFGHLKIETALYPPWTTAWIGEEGRRKLREFGIAPPRDTAAQDAAPAQCPRCSSASTEEISRFGSTPCKALHRCLACGEPFDRFKCH